jgi:uncharacterized protein
VPHFGLLLRPKGFHALSKRLRTAGVEFVIEPYLRFAGRPADQWTRFLRDPAGNALEFKAFTAQTQVFARWGGAGYRRLARDRPGGDGDVC